MPYVDGFVLPIPIKKLNEYLDIATRAAEIWQEYGALAYWECVLDDADAMEARTFPSLLATSPEETVILAWAVFSDKAARNEANGKICTDPRVAELMDRDAPLFDLQRMAYGGFKTLVKK